MANTLTSGGIRGFSRQNNWIPRGFARATQTPKVVESCSKAQKTQQVF